MEKQQIFIGRPCTKITKGIFKWTVNRLREGNKPILFILSGGVIDEIQIKKKLSRVLRNEELERIVFDKSLSVALLNKLFPNEAHRILSWAGVVEWTKNSCGITDLDLIKKISFDLLKLCRDPKLIDSLKVKYSDVVNIEDLYARYKAFLVQNNLSDSTTACYKLIDLWTKNPELLQDKAREYSGIVVYDAFKLTEEKLRVINQLIKYLDSYLIAGDRCSRELACWRNLPENIFKILINVPKNTSVHHFKENIINTKNTNEVLNNCYSELGDTLNTVSYREPGEINEIGYIESEDNLEEFIFSFARKYPKEKLLFCINNRNKVSELSFKAKQFPNLTIETPYMASKFEIDRTVVFIGSRFFSRCETPGNKVKDLSRMLANALPKSRGKNLLLVTGLQNCEQVKGFISTIKKSNVINV